MRAGAIFAPAFALLVALSAAPARASDASVDMVMLIQTLGIELHPDSTDYRNIRLTVGEDAILRSTIKNTGNGSQDYSVRIASTTGTWAHVSGPPGADEYRLTAVWHEWNTMFTTDTVNAAAEMQSNDVLTAGFKASGDTVFFNDSEFHATAGVKGASVPPLEERNLFFRVQGPSSASGPNSTAHVEISVSASP